jgi:hypothetical protein
MTLTRKKALVLIFVVTSLLIVDSTIVKYIAYSNQELPRRTYVGIFITFVMFFVGISVVILSFIEKKDPDGTRRRGLSLKNSYRIILITQLLLIAIFAIIIQSMLVSQNYNILSLFAAVYVSHVPALFFLLFLVLTLVEWIMIKKNRILSLYSLSFSLTALTIIISLIYATFLLPNYPSFIKPYPIHTSLYSVPSAALANYFGPTLDIISILSFVSVWIASAFLLSAYNKKLGILRYWLITAIPLVYFLFPFEKYFLNIFQSLLVSSPISFAITDAVIFSSTKQIGALFFSLAFLTASSLLKRYEIQKHLLIAAIGMTMLFGSIEIDSLLYATYPPFGLVTISFIPMGAFLVFTGIVNSASLVAKDKELRKEFYRTAMSQLDLLRVIGVTEMEKELIRNYKSIQKTADPSEKKDRRFEKDELREMLHDVVDDLGKDNVREILHDVLTELYSKSIPKK